MRRAVTLAFAAAAAGTAAAATGPAPSARQEAVCRLVSVGGYTHLDRRASGVVHSASGGIDYRCPDGTRVLADSAQVFENSNQVNLVGNVRFEDPGIELNADTATYWGDLRHLLAWSRVRVTNRVSGAVITGGRLNFFQATAVRPDRITVDEGHPHATVFPVAVTEADAAAADTTAAPPDTVPHAPDTVFLAPYEIDAERFRLEGRRYFRAGGDVVVVRDSLRAYGDSLDFDQEGGAMSVLGEARVEGQGYELTAATISVTPSSALDEELLAQRDARLSGSEVDMRAPAIRMFLTAGSVERLVAIQYVPELPGGDAQIDTRGLSPGDAERVRSIAAASEPDSAAADSLFRPVVSAAEFTLTGDSVEVKSPRQVLDLVTAVGAARAEAMAGPTPPQLPAGDGAPEGDSARTAQVPQLPAAASRDWMEGDTIYADFVSGSAADSASDSADDSAPDSAAPDPRNGAEPAAEPAIAPTGGTADPATPTRLETLTASGSARSLYRMAASDTAQAASDTAQAEAEEPQGPPALHWVEGGRITVFLDGRQVTEMHVEGQTRGYHFEPIPPGAQADTMPAADTAAVPDATAPPDTAALPDTIPPPPPDTAAVPPRRPQ